MAQGAQEMTSQVRLSLREGTEEIHAS